MVEPSSYVELRSSHPRQCDDEALARAMAAMPARVRELASTDVVSVVPSDHPSIPEEVAAKVRAGTGRNGVPSVTIGYEDGTVAVVVGQASDLGHEMIHAAQVFASTEARARSFAMAVADGFRIAAAVDRAVREGADRRAFSDLDWCEKAVRNASNQHETTGSVAYDASWDLHRQVHPKGATVALTASLGLDAPAAMAATFAVALAGVGFADFGADVAREVVAYRFQDETGALAFLFEEAAARAKTLRFTSTARAAFVRALDRLTSLPGATDAAVPLWVSKRDVDSMTLAPRSGAGEAYAVALRDAMPAVRQPVDEDVPDGRFADRHMGAFHLWQSFGDGEARRLWFGLQALAYRVAHLGERGHAVLEDLCLGSASRMEEVACAPGSFGR